MSAAVNPRYVFASSQLTQREKWALYQQRRRADSCRRPEDVKQTLRGRVREIEMKVSRACRRRQLRGNPLVSSARAGRLIGDLDMPATPISEDLISWQHLQNQIGMENKVRGGVRARRRLGAAVASADARRRW